MGGLKLHLIAIITTSLAEVVSIETVGWSESPSCHIMQVRSWGSESIPSGPPLWIDNVHADVAATRTEPRNLL